MKQCLGVSSDDANFTALGYEYRRAAYRPCTRVSVLVRRQRADFKSTLLIKSKRLDAIIVEALERTGQCFKWTLHVANH